MSIGGGVGQCRCPSERTQGTPSLFFTRGRVMKAEGREWELGAQSRLGRRGWVRLRFTTQGGAGLRWI